MKFTQKQRPNDIIALDVQQMHTGQVVMASDSLDVTYSRDELFARAEKLARESSMRTDARTALERVHNGELEGTMFASELTGIFFLLAENDRQPLAAE